MAITFPIYAVYNLAKADWWPIIEPSQVITNYDRWVYAHSTVLGDLPTASSYYTKSFNFLQGVNLSPDNDSSLRTDAYNAGFADGGNVSHGSDFLILGNYVGNQTISNINGIPVSDGLLYWAGQASGHLGPITRNWLEVISTDDLDTAISLVDGAVYGINIDDCSGITNTTDIVLSYPTTSPYTLSSAEGVTFNFNGTTQNNLSGMTVNGFVISEFDQPTFPAPSNWTATEYDIAAKYGPGQYCIVITDELNQQYCFSVIVSGGGDPPSGLGLDYCVVDIPLQFAWNGIAWSTLTSVLVPPTSIPGTWRLFLDGIGTYYSDSSWDGTGSMAFGGSAVTVSAGVCSEDPPFGLPGQYCGNFGFNVDLYWDNTVGKWSSSPGSPPNTAYELTPPLSLPGTWKILNPPFDEYDSDLVWDGTGCMTFFFYYACEGPC